MSESHRERQPLLPPDNFQGTAVYPVIHMIKQDVVHFIDTPLTYDALNAPDLTYTLVRPLEDKYTAIQQKGNKSVVFCFLLNRVHFLRDQNITTAPLSRSRAELCEILAVRVLRAHGSGDNTLQLTLAMTTSWPIYAGADLEVLAMVREQRDDLDERVGNAIELAIISKAKRFIKSQASQRVINSIWSGKCVYQAFSNHSILSDTYKRTPIHFYDPHKAPLLDHYRLKVPAIRSVLEYLNFITLFILFIWALEKNEEPILNTAEIAFMIFGLGFALEKVASMQEHGMRVYFTGTWNGFDLAFVTVFSSYAIMRLYGVFHDSHSARHTGIDCLALIAVLMFPRLAFVTLRNNLMVLSLRAMIVQFVALMLIAAFCFGGFLYALWTLSRNRSGYPVSQIAWWMLDLWFGLDASGFDRADRFHPVFGPILMVCYACLSNTLLLTVLVSILSHTFSTISEDAAAEAMFRKAVAVHEGVKSDPLFSYQPPVNLVALLIMWPASLILSPRWFHKLNVFMIRLTSFPLLLIIAWYERQSKRTGTSNFQDTVGAVAEKIFDTLPRQIKRLTFFEGLAGSGADIDAIFQFEEERTSALSDTEDSIPSAAQPIQGSNGQARSPPAEQPSPSPQKVHQDPSWLSSPTPPPRHRATSIVTRPAEASQSLTSPLAQVFQPFTFDVEGAIPEEEQVTQSAIDPPLSFGPVTRRRRLSSMHARTASVSSAGARRQPGHPQFGLSLTPPVTGSPELNTGGPLETAGQIKEEEGSGLGGTSLQLLKRLERVEEGQKRIEQLLADISRTLQSR